MYKCCWNCFEACSITCNSSEATMKIRASKRFCGAYYPVSDRLKNPFKQRYCKKFAPQHWFYIGHEITKKEAELLNKMTADELVEHWRKEEESRYGNARKAD